MNRTGTGFDYESLGSEYRTRRRSDPRIAAVIHEALGDARSVLNVGSGTGSYEPEDRYVVAVEPSAAMRAKRQAGRVPALTCKAEDLPFDDDAFDASMAILTVHHWPDMEAGLRELRRVTRGSVIVVTFDPDAETEFWIADYAPEMAEVDRRRYGPIARVAEGLGGQVEISPINVPRDCTDAFQVALFARPERFLEPETRAAQSAWAHLPEGVEERTVLELAESLESGEWDLRYGRLRSRPEIRCQLRLVVSKPE